jgi:hypothetical protein
MRLLIPLGPHEPANVAIPAKSRTTHNQMIAGSRFPPPLSVAAFGCLLHTHKPLTSSSRSAVCRLWGQFVGTYSTCAYAAYAGRQGTAEATRCGFTLRGRRRRGAAQGVPCAAP